EVHRQTDSAPACEPCGTGCGKPRNAPPSPPPEGGEDHTRRTNNAATRHCHGRDTRRHSMKTNFPRMVGQLAVRHADREALVNIERKRRYTHRELHLLTNRIVNMMREHLQLRRGDVYMCLLENDNLSLLHAWTALKGEAAVAYTNFRDSIDEHRWQVEF